MELDSRFWSVFMLLTVTALFLAAICTPYEVKGVAVRFGEAGLWNVDYNSTSSSGGRMGHFRTTQILLCLAAAALALTFVGYVMLCRKVTWLSQFIAFLAQINAGLLTIIAVGVFAANDAERNEGWWMALMAGVMFLVNAAVILIMPCLDSDEYKQPTRVIYIS